MIIYLQFKQHEGCSDTIVKEWMAYCAFHCGDYKKALHIYKNLLNDGDDEEKLILNVACCYFYLGMLNYLKF